MSVGDDVPASRVAGPHVAIDVGMDVAAPGPVTLLPSAIVAFLLTASAIGFMNGGSLNVDAFVLLQRWTAAWPDAVWSLVTVCGTGVVAFALLSPTLAWSPRWFAAGLAAAVVAGAYSNGVKRLFGLPRPASVLEAGQLHVIGETLHANTFPSGHSVTAFTVASVVVLAARRPLMAACWIVPCATLVAVSRIAVGAHWPADIAAGAAGGWAAGAIGVAAMARWRFWNTIDGVRAMALTAIGIGGALFLIDLGYPLARPLQYAAGFVAVVSGGIVFARPRLDPAFRWHRARWSRATTEAVGR